MNKKILTSTQWNNMKKISETKFRNLIHHKELFDKAVADDMNSMYILREDVVPEWNDKRSVMASIGIAAFFVIVYIIALVSC